MTTSDNIFQRALGTLLTEIFDVPPGNEAYLLNPGDSGLLRQLDSVDAEAASSRPMPAAKEARVRPLVSPRSTAIQPPITASMKHATTETSRPLAPGRRAVARLAPRASPVGVRLFKA